jgi:hypothetical protein
MAFARVFLRLQDIWRKLRSPRRKLRVETSRMRAFVGHGSSSSKVREEARKDAGDAWAEDEERAQSAGPEPSPSSIIRAHITRWQDLPVPNDHNLTVC